MRLKHLLQINSFFGLFGFLICFVMPTHVVANESCSLVLSQPDLDLGKTQRSSLNNKNLNVDRIPLKTRAITLSVFCKDPSVISLSFNGQPSSVDSFRFASYGDFKIKVVSIMADGVNANFVSNGKVESYFKPNESLTPYLNGNSIKGKNFTVQMEVYTSITLADTDSRAMKVWRGHGYFIVNANKSSI